MSQQKKKKNALFICLFIISYVCFGIKMHENDSSVVENDPVKTNFRWDRIGGYVNSVKKTINRVHDEYFLYGSETAT